MMKQGDYVVEKGNGIIYQIIDVDNDIAIIQGVSYRVKKRISVTSVEACSSKDLYNELEKENDAIKKIKFSYLGSRNKHLPGKILHIDGDKKYLDKCCDLYKEVGVYHYGVLIKEENLEDEILKYYYMVMPDIVVITGHDLYNEKGYKDVYNYSNSRFFINAIKKIRKVDKNVIIIAGACQSNFEALIASGADFASSPGRINIHTFDPAVIAVKAATTSITRVISLSDIFKYIENGSKAFGGLETFGKMRLMV